MHDESSINSSRTKHSLGWWLIAAIVILVAVVLSVALAQASQPSYRAFLSLQGPSTPWHSATCRVLWASLLLPSVLHTLVKQRDSYPCTP